VNLFGSSSTNQIASAQNTQSENPLDNIMDFGAAKPITATPPSSGLTKTNTSGILNFTNFTYN
jgi:hypothetical protein